MKYPRTFATADGESHFEEIELAPQTVQVVPGRPAFESSVAVATSAARMMHIGADWDGSWHTTPKRWFLVTLAGEMEITTSDGELLRDFELDPTRNYQPQPKREGCPETPVHGVPRHRSVSEGGLEPPRPCGH